MGSTTEIGGMSGENIKVLIDGVPAIGRLNGNIDLSQINLNNIEQERNKYIDCFVLHLLH